MFWLTLKRFSGSYVALTRQPREVPAVGGGNPIARLSHRLSNSVAVFRRGGMLGVLDRGAGLSQLSLFTYNPASER
jgi:hypothetical protein